jgi:hypothetical protein
MRWQFQHAPLSVKGIGRDKGRSAPAQCANSDLLEVCSQLLARVCIAAQLESSLVKK